MDGRQEYVSKVLDAYRATPETTGVVRRPDRVLAAQLHERGVPPIAVENALVLAAVLGRALPRFAIANGLPRGGLSHDPAVEIAAPN